MNRLAIITLALLANVATVKAADLVIRMNMVDASGPGDEIGIITARTTPYGVLFTPKLIGLAPGIHGFHVHQNPDCGPKEKDGKREAALAAGGHYDPANTGKHEGPYGTGHLGDLPALYVDAAGTADYPVLAPRLKLSDLKGHALMIHGGGDNHADQPAALGGGGARMACGIIR